MIFMWDAPLFYYAQCNPFVVSFRSAQCLHVRCPLVLKCMLQLTKVDLLVSGLLCHCDICKANNYTCETDGVCFTSTSLDRSTGVVNHNYRYCHFLCFFRPIDFYERAILTCQSFFYDELKTETRQNDFAVYCKAEIHFE